MGEMQFLERRRVAGAALLLWAVCLTLTIRGILAGTPLPPFFVTSSGDGAPRVAGLRVEFAGSAGDLQVDDRLLTLGGRDLDGVGAVDLYVVASATGRAGTTSTVTYLRDGMEGATQIRFASFAFLWPLLTTSAAWAILAGVLLFRSSWSSGSRLLFWAALAIAFMLASLFTGSRVEVWLAIVVNAGANVFLGPLLVLFLLGFPDRHLANPGAAGDDGAMEHGGAPKGPSPSPPAWPWLFSLSAPLHVGRLFGVGIPVPISQPGFFIVLAILSCVCMGILLRNRRRTNRMGQTRIRWVLIGFAVGLAPLLVGATLAVMDARFVGPFRALMVMGAALPLSLLFAIFRHRYFNVERILRATTLYALLATLLIAMAGFLATRLLDYSAGAFSPWIPLGEGLAALSLAVVLVPVYRRLRPFINRTLFRERFTFSEGFGTFLARVGGSSSLDEMCARAGAGLQDLLDPRGCAVYVRARDAFTPVFFHGPVDEKDMALDGPLSRRLTGQEAPWVVGAPTNDDGQSVLALAERALLDALRAEVVVPISRRSELMAFLVLGEKSSGDIYTSSDLAFLRVVSSVISCELERFDDSKLAVVGESMARMMHDLRNPLGLVSCYTDMIAETPDPAARRGMQREMEKQFVLMERMINDVLAFTRGESPVLIHKVKVGAFLSDLRQQILPGLAASGVELRISPGFEGEAYFDVVRVARALLNIARNAVEAMPEGGVLSISTHADGDQLRFDVTDNGPGIDAELLPRVFESFSTAGKAGGTGLGLATVKSVAEAHGGTVSVESRPGAGARFRLSIPMRLAAA